MGIGLILLLGFTCYASAGCTGPALAKREHRLTLWAPGRYLFGDWIPAGCLRLPDYRYWQDTLPAAEAYRNMWLMGWRRLAW